MPIQCRLRGNDNYRSFATYQHGLIVLNGQCALQNSQLVDLEYQFVRTIGAVLGVGWSQVHPNLLTGQPYPTSDDYAGFPLMHSIDPASCYPVTRCFANPYQLTMDDIAAISRISASIASANRK